MHRCLGEYSGISPEEGGRISPEPMSSRGTGNTSAHPRTETYASVWERRGRDLRELADECRHANRDEHAGQVDAEPGDVPGRRRSWKPRRVFLVHFCEVIWV